MEGGPGQEPSIQNSFSVNGQEIALLSDAAHILKAIRNAFMNNKVLHIHDKHVDYHALETNDVFWEAIVKLVEFDEQRELKIAPHLSRACIHITNFTKMSVSLAMKVLSLATAAALKLACLEYPDQFPSYYLTTVFFIEQVAHWWEIAHSRTSSKCFFSKDDDKEWNKSTRALEQFMDLYSNMIISDHQVEGYWPSQRAVLLTSFSILWIANKLVKEGGYHFFLPGRCLNDCIENFFSLVRGINKAPTALLFKRFAKAIAVSQFIKYTPRGNYEQDDSLEYLTSLEDFRDSQQCVDEEYNEDEEMMAQFEKDDFDPEDFAEDNALAYFGGSILKQIVKGNCQECEEELFAPDEDQQECNNLIRLKEYSEGSLVSPSTRANQMFKIAELTFRAIRTDLLKVNKNLNTIMVKKVIEAIKEEIPSTFLPSCHLNKIVTKFIRARLNFWAKFSNALLRLRHKKEIEEAANGSASMKQVQVTKNC